MSRFHRSLVAMCLVSFLGGWFRANAAGPSEPAAHETVEVTATRVPENPIEVPASIQIVSGEDLDRLQIRTLQGALALVMGVSVAPGGDGGPASSVPEMMGLREFDAFLLVVDDVPWGGAFNPALATLSLENVDRIEVLRGAAPVLYGATSFVGVIHVIHRTPAATPMLVRASYGSYDSYGVGGYVALPSVGTWQHSISASYDTGGFNGASIKYVRGHLLYRGLTGVGRGKLRLDFDATLLGQEPDSPTPRQGTELTTLVPIDSNQNPADSKMDEDRYQVTLSHHTPALGGNWTTTLSVYHSERENTKGFLRDRKST